MQQQVLSLLLARGPMSDQDIVMALISDATTGRVLDAIETLGRRGHLVDTGERGPWTTRGRSIIWRPA